VLSPAGLGAADRAEIVCTLELSDELEHMSPVAFFSAPLNSIPGMADALYEFMGTPSTGFDRPVFLAWDFWTVMCRPRRRCRYRARLDGRLHVVPP
jgi:hypothetical protein